MSDPLGNCFCLRLPSLFLFWVPLFCHLWFLLLLSSLSCHLLLSCLWCHLHLHLHLLLAWAYLCILYPCNIGVCLPCKAASPPGQVWIHPHTA